MHFFSLTVDLHSSQLTINTAIVYMHRFYMHHSFTKFHRNVSILSWISLVYPLICVKINCRLHCADNLSHYVILGRKSRGTTSETRACDQGCARLPKSPRITSRHKKQCKFQIFQMLLPSASDSPVLLWFSHIFAGLCPVSPPSSPQRA